MPIKKHKTGPAPLMLCIIDGWGAAPASKGNAITLAGAGVFQALEKRFPHTLLHASGRHVGLPGGEYGNSEAGHMNIGAGRIVLQDSVKISESIKDKTFFRNAAFIHAIWNAKNSQSNFHLMGMISEGSTPHSSMEHLASLIELLRKSGLDNVYLHLFTDGRDSPKHAAAELLEKFQKRALRREKISTVMGRFYGMDRKKAWERTEAAYDCLVLGSGRKSSTAAGAVRECYSRGEDDEFMSPCVIEEDGAMLPRISDEDSVVFFNLRSDRARQLAKAFTQARFESNNPKSFKRKKVLKGLVFVALTDFGPNLDSALTAYPSAQIDGTLPFLLQGFRQLYLAESEKFPHVSYFFNGGYVGSVAGEELESIPSPEVKSYDEVPAMRTHDLVRKAVDYARDARYDTSVMNIAAPDMIGHTGNLAAGIECCRAVEKAVGGLVEAYLDLGGEVLITSDHGNIEEMINLATGEPDTEHSANPVPFILASRRFEGCVLRGDGSLRDIAPTVLDMVGLEKPRSMNGKSLIIRRK